MEKFAFECRAIFVLNVEANNLDEAFQKAIDAPDTLWVREDPNNEVIIKRV